MSLDGRKEINDKLRVTPNGKGCYDTIVPKYQKLVKERGTKNYYVRGTFTRENFDFTADLMHLYELGFHELSIEPVVSDSNLSFALTEKDIEKAKAEYETLALKILSLKKAGESINFFHFMIDLDQGPCAIKRLRGCSCGNEYVAVTPNGDIYPCHQFVGMDDFKMGSLHDGSLNSEMKQFFSTANIFNKKECGRCWARFYCSGGCNANSHQYAGDMFSPHVLSCELEKKRIECAVMIKADLAN
ncbi:MAG: hypothetical protein BGN88_07330 [Clostridiales bacterium 43-6]|nr:MAG: hypothetical protein BGN88_07330 [Clostridiales bacterium 43-6]